MNICLPKLRVFGEIVWFVTVLETGKENRQIGFAVKTLTIIIV